MSFGQFSQKLYYMKEDLSWFPGNCSVTNSQITKSQQQQNFGETICSAYSRSTMHCVWLVSSGQDQFPLMDFIFRQGICTTQFTDKSSRMTNVVGLPVKQTDTSIPSGNIFEVHPQLLSVSPASVALPPLTWSIFITKLAYGAAKCQVLTMV